MAYFNDKKTGDPKWIAGDEEHEQALAQCGVSVEAICRVTGQPVRWLVENVVPREAVTVIAGEPGAGKTFFACQLAADAARVSQCRVVLATSGYESLQLVRWRLDQADADTRRIVVANLTPNGFNDRRAGPSGEMIDERMAVLYHTLLGAGDPASGILPSEEQRRQASGIGRQEEEDQDEEKTEGKRQMAKTETDETEDLRPKSSAHSWQLPEPARAAELLVIDDVDGWFGKPGQCVSAAVLARVIQRLNELARSLHVAIVVLVRAQMSAEGRLTSRQLSRLAQSASVVWMVVKDREDTKAEGGRQKAADETTKTQDLTSTTSRCDPESNSGVPGENPNSGEPRAYSQSARRWLLPVKNNLAPDAATFGRAFELLDGQIRWHADDPAPSLAEATLPSAHNSDRRRLRHAAGLWLQEALAAGPLPSKELFRQGVENGFSKGTLQRAATELGIHPHKTGFDGGWEMRWTPRPAVCGRGTAARPGAPKVFAGGDEATGGGNEDGVAAPRQTERQRDKQTSRQVEAVSAFDSSCASSRKYEEFDAASCAPSEDRRDRRGTKWAKVAENRRAQSGPG